MYHTQMRYIHTAKCTSISRSTAMTETVSDDAVAAAGADRENDRGGGGDDDGGEDEGEYDEGENDEGENDEGENEHEHDEHEQDMNMNMNKT